MEKLQFSIGMVILLTSMYLVSKTIMFLQKTRQKQPVYWKKSVKNRKIYWSFDD
jgi:hypothetical protein